MRYISHIPSRYFKMVRYYGFLANRKRGSLLPEVYAALDMKMKEKLGFTSLIKQFTRTDPYQCILCVTNDAKLGLPQLGWTTFKPEDSSPDASVTRTRHVRTSAASAFFRRFTCPSTTPLLHLLVMASHIAV